MNTIRVIVKSEKLVREYFTYPLMNLYQLNEFINSNLVINPPNLINISVN